MAIHDEAQEVEKYPRSKDENRDVDDIANGSTCSMRKEKDYQELTKSHVRCSERAVLQILHRGSAATGSQM